MFPYPFSFLGAAESGLAQLDNGFYMEFDGVDDAFLFQNEYFMPSVINQDDGQHVGSLSFWFKLPDPAPLGSMLAFNAKFAGPYLRFFFQSSIGWADVNTYMQIVHYGADTDGGGGGEMGVTYKLYDQAFGTYGTSSVDWQPDTWYHCAWVFDKDATNRTTLYLDGHPYPLPNTTGSTDGARTIGDVPYSLPYTATASAVANNCTIGSYYFYNGTQYGNWSGKMDEVSIFDYALTAPDVADIYNATDFVTDKCADLSSMSTPPIAWYRMGD